MKAAIMRNGKIVVDDMATPTPSEGEVLVKTAIDSCYNS